MRRVACIALPEIRVEIAEGTTTVTRASATGEVLAVVIARRGGSVKTEREVLGNTRLDVVSRAARAAGIRAGMTVAAARAKHSELRVRVVAEDAVEGALARVAEVAMAFGPAAAFDVTADVVWVEIGGCAHLHADGRSPALPEPGRVLDGRSPALPEPGRVLGEAVLARGLAVRVRALGHVCTVAVADGPCIASAVARYGESPAGEPRLVPAGLGAEAMRALPIAALALDDDVTRWLGDLGLRRCGDLQKLPRRSLGTRLGARAHDVMQLLDGEDRAPLDAWRPPEVPEERGELEWGAESTEALAFVLKTLCDRLAARLHGRAMAAARLELVLTLDRALCHGAAHVSTLTALLPAPLSRAADLLAVLRVRLEQHTLAAPALAVTLRAPELARAPGRTLDMLEPEPRAALVLPRLVAELSAELGPARVGVLALCDTWSPDERTRLVPYGAPPPVTHHAMGTSVLEPSRLVEPSRTSFEELVSVHPLARYEATEWWRRGPRRRDLAAAWIGSAGEGALAWVELGEDDVLVRGWVD